MTCSSILPIVLFALALTGVVRANDQQTQQACVNAAICLLAVRSGLSPDRRPDLQAHFMSSVFRECRGLVRSATPRYPYCLRFLARARAAPRPAVFDPAAPARSYRVGAARPDRKPLAEGGCGGCALWDFRLGDRAPDPWACGRRTARGEFLVAWPPVLADERLPSGQLLRAAVAEELRHRRSRVPNRKAAAASPDGLALCWILASAERDRSLNLHLKGAALPLLSSFPRAREGGASASGFRSGGAGAELSGRSGTTRSKTAGRGGLWRVCALGFQVG